MKFLAFAAASSAQILMKTEITDYLMAPNLMSSLVQSVLKTPQPGQKVEWEECDTDLGVFDFDEDATTATPNPPTKGTDVHLGLAGSLSDEMDLTNLHIHVDWNSSPLYDEDHKVTEGPFTDDDFNYDLVWAVPSYAFDGLYQVRITGTQDDGQSVLCVNAAFMF